jgi:1-deoxy-D-xylulose-5-phosphate synthase
VTTYVDATDTQRASALLDTIDSPEDVRALDADQLTVLAAQIRAFLVDHVTQTGGHLGPNLGVVELTIALHRVFRTPHDSIVYDTGHQSYVHKILTGRREAFGRLRKADGLSGYPCRDESEHDLIENSHASTSLSYADGLAKAHALRGVRGRHVVAVVGDGALTGGIAWEALNNIGAAQERPVVVVLNDNGRSYDPTTGALSHHLSALRHRPHGRGGPPADGTADGSGALFEALGFAYLGPVDGHDCGAVERALRHAAGLGRPVIVHCVTAKGKGYLPAERDDADRLHAVGVVDRATGRPHYKSAPTWTTVFGEEIRSIGDERPDVVCLTAAMLQPTGLLSFAQAHPDRVFDVGIAEQHAVTSAAGLAMGGLHPVVALYSTFLNRAFDQVLMDVALHRLPVTFVLDRAGVTGPDGPSHHGMWDLSLLALVPGLRVAAPRDPLSLRELLREAVDQADGPTALRFPKASAGPDVPALERRGTVDILTRSHRHDALLVAVGPLAVPCLQAADALTDQGLGVTVVDPRWTAPLDDALVELARAHRLVVTVEDNTVTGGLGSRLGQALADSDGEQRVCSLALPSGFLPHDSRDALLRQHGLDTQAITAAVLDRLHGTDDGPSERTQP